MFHFQGVRYRWSARKFLLNLLIVTVFTTLLISHFSNIVKATPEKKLVTITIHRGETLWSIAERIAPNSDPRIVISDIKLQNQLTTANLIAGTRIVVPAEL